MNTKRMATALSLFAAPTALSPEAMHTTYGQTQWTAAQGTLSRPVASVQDAAATSEIL